MTLLDQKELAFSRFSLTLFRWIELEQRTAGVRAKAVNARVELNRAMQKSRFHAQASEKLLTEVLAKMRELDRQSAVTERDAATCYAQLEAMQRRFNKEAQP